MNNPLNELSAVYNQSIAEGCGCDKKKEVKVKAELSGTKRPDGGDGAAPNDGKNPFSTGNYPMGGDGAAPNDSKNLLPTGNVPNGGSGAKRRASKYAVEPLATEEYKDLPKRKMGMKAGKKTLGAIGHAIKTGTDGVGSIESQKREQQANKKAKQADKIHGVAKSHSPELSRMKNIKNRLTGMAKEGYAPGDVDKKVGAVTSISKDEREAAKERLLAKAKAKRAEKLKEDEEKGKIGGGNLKKLATKATKRVDADVDGDVDTDDMKSSEMGEFIPSADGKKKIKTKARFESAYSNWRDETDILQEVLVGGTYGGDSDSNVENPKAKTDDKSNQKIVEKDIKNKIKINPPQGMNEAFAEIGGVISEMYEIELDEKIDLKKADMGDVIKDFRKSDAPQFKGKSDKKIQKMAIAAKLEADGEGGSVSEETEEEKEKRKRDLMARTKEHDDKRDGRLAEGRALAGVLSTIRAKNGVGKVCAKGADKLQDKKEKTMEELSIDQQMKISRDAAKKRNPNPDHKAIRGKMLKKPLPKDTRTDAQKMTDATGPRPGSRYRGD